jgi:hypothetical protein
MTIARIYPDAEIFAGLPDGRLMKTQQEREIFLGPLFAGYAR